MITIPSLRFPVYRLALLSMLCCVALTISVRAQQPKQQLQIRIANAASLRTGPDDAKIDLDVSALQLPTRIRMTMEAYRIYPTLKSEKSVRKRMVAYKKFLLPRIRPGSVKKLSLVESPDQPVAVGLYEIHLTVDEHQLPNVDAKVAAREAGRRGSVIVFSGNVSRALTQIKQEWDQAILRLAELNEIGVNTKPADPDSGYDINVIVQNMLIDAPEMFENDEELKELEKSYPGITRAYNATKDDDSTVEEDEITDENGTGTEDQQPEEEEEIYLYDTREGVSKISIIAAKAHFATRSMTQPDLGTGVSKTGMMMVHSLLDGGRRKNFDSYLSVQRLFLLRTLLLNYHYYLNESQNFFEEQYPTLQDTAKPSALHDLQQEQSKVRQAAQIMWTDLRSSVFTKVFYQKILDDLESGLYGSSQVGADCKQFLRAILKEKFLEGIEDYLTALDAWHDAWQLQFTEEDPDPTAVARAKKNLDKASANFTKVLKAKGVIGEAILEEGETLEDLLK